MQKFSFAFVIETFHKESKNHQNFFSMRDSELLFIESPWATPCLVLNNYMYNCHSRKNNKQYWRCHNYSKKHQDERCRSRCVLENGKLKSCTGGNHNHPPHKEKIEKMLARNRMVTRTSSRSGLARIKLGRQPVPLHMQPAQLIQHLHPAQQEELIASSIMLLQDNVIVDY